MRGRYERRTWQHDPAAYAPPRYRRACGYEVFLPEPLAGFAPGLSAATVATLSEAERALQTVGGASERALAPLARLLLRTESIASSKVEGLHVDARDLARSEARADTGAKVGPTVAEVLGNIDAMQLAIEEAVTSERFDRSQILAIHRQLMSRAPNPRNAGRIRTQQNWVGGNDFTPCGAEFVPPPPELVDPLLEDLCAAITDDSMAPLVQAALVHAQFETIHPFDDGNGRTGRTLIHVVLRRRRITRSYVPPISVLFARGRDRYIAGLTGYRHEEVEAWVEQFAAAAARAALLASTYLDATEAMQRRWQAQLRARSDPRADAAAWSVIEALPAHPVITAAVATAATGRAKAAVYAALEQLEDAGVLRPLSGGRRNRSWEAAGLLDLVAQLEEGQKPQAEPHE
ncbi:MAG: Fic family protein [Actinobacteria bacterium]|nr:Fic family protein [Actinomycetota bacterium]